MSVRDLEERVASLPTGVREAFHRIYWVQVGDTHLRLPPEMEMWVRAHLGEPEEVARQTVVRVVNRWTGEGALFNPLRARRPRAPRPSHRLDEEVRRGLEGDPFGAPETLTPEDPFGRVRGRWTLSAANVARGDVWHAVLVMEEGDPQRLTVAQMEDAFRTAHRWCEEAHRHDPEARHPVVLWNCLWRAGASRVHSHLQALVARGRPYGPVALLRDAAARYRQREGRDYWEDVREVHRALGLAVAVGSLWVLAYLTPRKEREVLVLAPRPDGAFWAGLARVVEAWRSAFGVASFNLAVWLPDLGSAGLSFPPVARLVDRGDPSSPVCDIAGMELYGEPIVASDPFDVARGLAGALPV